jgi:hypothetical protein
MSKSQKQLPNCLKIAETRVVLIVLNYVLYRVHAYIVTISCRRLFNDIFDFDDAGSVTPCTKINFLFH